MKLRHLPAILASVASTAALPAMADYTNYLRQVQFPSGVVWDVTIPSEGSSESPLALDTEGSRFELWTIDQSGQQPVSYLLDNKFIDTYDITSSITIVTDDPEARFPRTRADHPFQVIVTVDGMLSESHSYDDDDFPEGSTRVKLLRHVQSYGEKGTPASIDPNQAILLKQSYINENGTINLDYPVTSIPGDDRTKIRGEERFSVYTLDTEEKVASATVQIWPVADGTISGLKQGDVVHFKTPQLTVSLNDLYPKSDTYVQVYKGQPVLGTTGSIVPGTSIAINQEVPEDRVLVVDDYDGVFGSDGTWTMELLTSTPFGTDRLAHFTFDIDRTLTIKGMLTTQE